MMMTQLANPAPKHQRKRPHRARRFGAHTSPGGRTSWFSRLTALRRPRYPLPRRTGAPEVVTATEPELAQAR